MNEHDLRRRHVALSAERDQDYAEVSDIMRERVAAGRLDPQLFLAFLEEQHRTNPDARFQLMALLALMAFDQVAGVLTERELEKGT